MSEVTVLEPASLFLKKNRATKINPDPFCPVVLKQLSTADKQSIDSYVVALQPGDNPSATAEDYTPVPGKSMIHGTDYKLITNSDARDLADSILAKIGQRSTAFPDDHLTTKSKTFWDGKRFAAKYIFPEITANINNRPVNLGLGIFNSYDGSMPLKVSFYILRMNCFNQFRSSNSFDDFVFYHFVNGTRTLAEDINMSIEHLRAQIDQFPTKVEKMFSPLVQLKLEDTTSFLRFRHGLIGKWPSSLDANVLDELENGAVTKEEGLVDGWAGPPVNLWNIANAYTAVSTHKVGGIRGDELGQMVMDHALTFVN